MNRKKLMMISTVMAVLLVPGFLAQIHAGAGCQKAAAAATAHAEGGDHGATPCCGKNHAEDGQPCCAKGATQAALVALKSASEMSGSPEARSAYETAVASVEKVNASAGAGCPKIRGAAQEAMVAALKEAGRTTACPKAKAAVETALVAYQHEPQPENQAATR